MKELVRKLYMNNRPLFNKIKDTLSEPIKSMEIGEFLST